MSKQKRVNQGRVDALYSHHYQRVFRFARRSLSLADAEDIAQDVFVGLLGLHDIDHRELTGSYLLKIAQNLMKRRWRQGRRRAQVISRYFYPMTLSGASLQNISEVEAEETRNLLANQLRELPPHEHKTIRFIVCGEMPYAAAARSLGVRDTTVNNWRHRAVDTLKKRFNAQP